MFWSNKIRASVVRIHMRMESGKQPNYLHTSQQQQQNTQVKTVYISI